MPDLALAFQFHKSADGFLERHLRIRTVKLIDIDLFDPQPLQAALTGGAKVLRAPVRFPHAGPRPVKPSLGGNHEILRIRMQRLRDQSLAHLWTVGIGSVDEVDPERHRPPQHTLAFLAVGGFTPDPFSGDTHGAEPEAIDRKVTADIDGSRECGRDCARPICHDVLLANGRLCPTLGAGPGTMPRGSSV